MQKQDKNEIIQNKCLESSNSCFNNNLKLLAPLGEYFLNQFDQKPIQHIKLLTAKNGQLTIEKNNKMIHSQYNPKKEAATLATLPNINNTSMIIVIGFGLGYHIQEILNFIKDRQIPIFIFPLDEEILYTAFCNKDLHFLTDKRIHLLWQKNRFEEFYHWLNQIPVSQFKGYRMIKLPGEINLASQVKKNLLSPINEILKEYFYNQLTSLQMIKKWILNAMENLVYLSDSLDYKKIMEKVQGKPGMVVSAGPSLKKSIPFINRFKQNNGVILCVDTALRSLLESGIVPDIIISVDAQFQNYRDFEKKIHFDKPLLMCDITCYSRIARDYHSPLCFFKSEKIAYYPHHLIQKLELIAGKELMEVISGGSVSISALDIAVKLKLNPILLIGQDFSYCPELSHATSSPYYHKYLKQSHYFAPLATQFHHLIHKKKYIYKEKSSRGSLRISDPVMHKFKSFLEDYVAFYSDVLIFNATFDGLKIENTPILSPLDGEDYGEFFLYTNEQKNSKKYEKKVEPSRDFYNFKLNNSSMIKNDLSLLLNDYSILLHTIRTLVENQLEQIEQESLKQFSFIHHHLQDYRELIPYFSNEMLMWERGNESDQNQLFWLGLLSSVKKLEKKIQKTLRKMQ